VTLNAPMTDTDPVLQTAEQWAASLRLMHALASSHGSKFLAVVQPNQWFRASPTYTPRAAPDDFTERVARSVPPGYRALLAHLPDLRTQGVTVLDHTRLFDSEPDNIYSDDCCHLSKRGNAMLLEAVAQWLIR
jgi:hypothetical protein